MDQNVLRSKNRESPAIAVHGAPVRRTSLSLFRGNGHGFVSLPMGRKRSLIFLYIFVSVVAATLAFICYHREVLRGFVSFPFFYRPERIAHASIQRRLGQQTTQLQHSHRSLRERRSPRSGRASSGLERTSPAFSLETAALLSGFAFETYNTPASARWEVGEDGCDVALLSEDFVPNVYKGVLSVTLVAAEGLRQESELGESLLTGSASDPYVLFNVVEDPSKSILRLSGFGQGALNEERQGDSVDVRRTSTQWRGGGGFFDGQERVTWGDGEGEAVQLYIRNPETARLGIRVMDENVAKADELLGANEIELKDYISSGRAWNGTISLLFKEKNWDWGLAATGAAATAITGLATGGAALAVGAAVMAAKALSGAGEAGLLHMKLNYLPLQASTSVTNSGAAPGFVPVGATPGIDWGTLATSMGGLGLTASQYDFIGFVSNRDTNTQAGLWRDQSNKRIILAFRGTQQDSLRDFMTDTTIVKTSWESRADGSDAEKGEALVHAGFREALNSVAQRLKGLISAACGDPSDWEVLLTGHSLGGALATLMAADLADGLDTSRALPIAPDRSWLSFFTGGDKPPQSNAGNFSRISLYTFGTPRVGDEVFSAMMNRKVPIHFRVVNNQDVVARYPRGYYVHAGRTVMMVNEAENEKAPGRCDLSGLWVENETDGRCPLRDDNVLASPLDRKGLLGKLASEIEAGPLAKLKASVDNVAVDADELRSRLSAVSGAAREDLSSLASSADESVKQIRGLFNLVSEVRGNISQLEACGASTSQVQKLEENAVNAVTEELQKILDQAAAVGANGTRVGSALASSTAGDVSKQAAASSKLAAERANSLGATEKGAVTAMEGLKDAMFSFRDAVRRPFSEASVGQYASVIGLDTEYIDGEMLLLKALTTGGAVKQHLEPSYYDAMVRVIREYWSKGATPSK